MLVALVIAVAGCADSTTPTDPLPTNPSTTARPAPARPSTTTTTPAATSTSLASANGVVTISGRGDHTIPLPATVPLPVIVHARHDGEGSFAVNALDSLGQPTVVASALGPYNGTVAVGFVEAANNPTRALRVVTTGPWQLAIGPAALAPPLGRGVQGDGDTVLSYRGAGADAHLTYRGRSRLVVNVYENGGVIPLVDTKGPFDGQISLIAGPAFIAVTTAGKWSMSTG